MGIYSDGMTQKGKLKRANKRKDIWKKKLQKKSVGRVERIYMDGLSEYVSDGCEDNVVLNIVITF